MRDSNSKTPTPLREVRAADVERRILSAASAECPSEELTRRMEQALGISMAAGATLAATQGLGVSGGKATASLSLGWLWGTVGAVALAASGVAVGVWWSHAHPAASPASVAVIAVAAPVAEVRAPVGAGDNVISSSRPTKLGAAVPLVPRRTKARPEAGDLAAEIGLVDAARTAVATGGEEKALVLLRRYEATYPSGTFRPEATVLRIEALDRLGRKKDARDLARTFVAAHPESALADRVARVTGVSIH